MINLRIDIAELCKLGVTPVIVHGGGPQIAKMLKVLNVESSFVDGLRVTDEVIQRQCLSTFQFGVIINHIRKQWKLRKWFFVEASIKILLA